MIRALQKLQRRNLAKRGFESWIVLMRILFGLGWLLAGVTKITGKSWFSEPGVFLRDYLIDALGKPHVPGFYKYFIEEAALNHVMFLNYIIPAVQIILGLMLIIGLLTFPSILIFLFMHINFILSGNMNLISLTLYTSAFGLLLSGRRAYILSLDRYFKLENLFVFNKNKYRSAESSNEIQQEDMKKLLQYAINEISASVEEMQAAQNHRIEKLIAYLEETHFQENKKLEQQLKQDQFNKQQGDIVPRYSGDRIENVKGVNGSRTF
ncbi:DoxX family membrane protein [Paenibacillus alkaliterrae]|uniref:DoxX family membrane protein n=1 Tax=Paenibacillus alkaliterrae TaxID=320909 RepID=UPI001F3D2C77|nr:DoxX family membrane protein [Paenibacillus alkaliterrae]MCF2941822.1 DoxX family membrane protein [Paenibacillus alkaliterrae]